MKYVVTFLINYTIDNAIDKWDAIEQAENIFNSDTHFDYEASVAPINEEEEDPEDWEDDVDECGYNPYMGCYDFDC